MALDPAVLSQEVLDFLGERHLGTLTTLRADGSPHVVAVGFTFDASARVVRIITFAPSQKARNAARGGRAAVCQVDGGRWLTLEGGVRLVRILRVSPRPSTPTPPATASPASAPTGWPSRSPSTRSSAEPDPTARTSVARSLRGQVPGTTQVAH